MTVQAIEPKRARREPAGETAPHVIRAMNLVSARLAEEGISKSRSNSQQGYKFRGIDEVLNALSAIISSEKLVIIPHVESRELTERQTKNGGALFSVVVRVRYTFVSAEDGSRETIGPFDGEAMDSADKATNKAMSAAYKYMAIQTFCIPTEGDNDADATTHEVAPAAVGERSPRRDPQPRQQLNSSQAKKEDAWGRFTRTLEGFTDLDDLESWWADGGTQAKIETMPAAWQEQAAEAYEKKQEALMNAGRP
jgi:hypothetical protein